MKIGGRLAFSLYVALALIVFGSRTASGADLLAAPPHAQAQMALDAFVENEAGLEHGGFGAILFSDKGEIWAYESESAERTVPFGKNTPLLVGELSGRFVILAVARLASQKKLDLDKPIGAYLPEVSAKASRNANLAKIGKLSVRTVAAEATGWVDTFPRALRHYRLARDLLPALASRPNRYPPGIRQTKSGAMIDLLALLVERVSKKPWNRAISSEVFAPLGMVSSSFVPASAAVKGARYYYRDGVEFDSSITGGLVLPFTPSACMRSSLSDLAACGASLLASFAGKHGGALSTAAVRALFAPCIPGQLDRQGFESGMGWNLTDYRISHLGRVAWAYSSLVSHRSMLLLLLDQGVGIALASTLADPAGPPRLRRIALDLIQLYAGKELGIEKPAFRIPPTFPSIPSAARPVPGLYASRSGVATVGLDGELLTLSARGGYSEFAWTEGGTFIPAAENEFANVEFGEGGRMTIRWRSGARMNVSLHPAAPLEPELKSGVYRLERKRTVRRTDTVLIEKLEGSWIITADEGQSYLLAPNAQAGMDVLCDEGSILYGCRVSVDAEGRVHVIAP